MNKRIKQLAEQASCDIKDEFGYWVGREFDKEKFAELIVRECAAALFDESERLSGLSLNEDNCEEYEIRSNQCIDDIALIEKHFGVKE